MPSNEKILIAIPARGGSKRLLRKNVKDLNGKPMLAYTIEAALMSALTPHVYVCTEDDEIAEVAEKYGARVFRIAPEMAEDDVSSTTPCLHLHTHLQEQGHDLEILFNLQPSSPLRNAEDITGAYDQFIRSGADFLVSTTEIDPHYFHWALKETDGAYEMYFGNEFMKERIYLPTVYRPNGAIKLARTEALIKHGNYFGKPLTAFSMPESRSIHVATAFDFLCCKAMLSH
ncbi:MAG: acylneuraminate cytidylyltransferase family protein [Flavobacteriales bacterium]|nr:acylneuraminate cytidylyltransferase family protein [Flavobacteriales bacterium]